MSFAATLLLGATLHIHAVARNVGGHRTISAVTAESYMSVLTTGKSHVCLKDTFAHELDQEQVCMRCPYLLSANSQAEGITLYLMIHVLLH